MPPLSPQRRRRGVCLTPQGLHKLQTAKHQLEWSDHERQRLTLEDLTARTRLDAHTLCKILTGTVRVDRKSLVQCFMAFNLTLEPADYESPPLPGATFPHPLDPNDSPQVPVKLGSSLSPAPHTLAVPSSAGPWIDGESLPDVPLLVGRELELETLSQWVQPDRGRVITILGMAGSGKTSLVAKLIEQLSSPTETSPPRFQVMLWRSLRHAPTAEATLTELLQLLSPHSLPDCPTTLQVLISRLLQVLHQIP